MKFKKIFSVCLAASALFLFAGCSDSRHGLNPKDPTEIVLWHYFNGAQAVAFDELVTEFNNTAGAEEGIFVNPVSKSSVDDLADAVTASAQKKVGADELPNIFQCYLDTAVSLDNLDILTDLSPYLEKEEKDSYVQGYLEEGMFGKENALKLFPVVKSTELLVLNETDWAPFALVTDVDESALSTWEGLAKTAEQYYRWSGGKSFFGRDSFANYMIIGSKQLGAEIFQVEDGTVSLNLDETVMRRLWDNYYIPYIRGWYQHIGRFRTDDMKIGEIIAAVGSNPGMSYLPYEVADQDGSIHSATYKILPLPNFAGCEPYAVQQGASMAVTKTDETREYASMLFLKWLTQEENNIRLAVSSGYLPVKTKANDMEKIHGFIEKNKLSLTPVEVDTLDTAIRQIKDSHMFTSKGFSHGSEARSVLNSSMLSLAQEDRKAILQKTSEGIPEEEACREYLTDEYFHSWYQSLKEQLHEICSQ